MVGNYAYVLADAGLVVISIADPTQPQVKKVVGAPFLNMPSAIQVQARYAFACDKEGLKILDVLDLKDPRPVAALPLPDARNVYVARTYAYVAGGSQGLVIVDVTNATQPKVDQVFNDGGAINDLNDVKLGMTYVSEFAYLADGCNGLRIVQLTSPETPGNYGFSPRPTPRSSPRIQFQRGARPMRFPRGSIAIGLSTNRAIKLPSLDAWAPSRSASKSSATSTCYRQASPTGSGTTESPTRTTASFN